MQATIKNLVFFSTKNYDIKFFTAYNSSLPAENQFSFTFLDERLDEKTAQMTGGFDSVCIFVNDCCNAAVLETLHSLKVKVIALRCAGFNNVDLKKAKELGMKVVRVPAYSPYAVAEHAMALLMALNRKTHKAYNRVREDNYDINGLYGFNLNKKTIGIVGTGKIGCCFASICKGFNMNILGYDPYPSKFFTEECGGKYVSLEEIWKQCDVISLHVPLMPETKYIINAASIDKMKTGVYIINTSRGALLNTIDAIEKLKSKQIGGLGIDVYEQEDKFFFKDLSEEINADDVFSRLMTFPNVIITGHQAFFTKEALVAISEVTLNNLLEINKAGESKNEVK